MTDEEEEREREQERVQVVWTDAERRVLGSLETEAPPPPGVEDRVVEELSRRGAFAPLRRPAIGRRPPAAVLVAGAAAAAALFVAGVLVGVAVGVGAGARGQGPPSEGRAVASAEPRFALFLLDEPPGGAAEEPARVAEYKRWAASLPGGRLVTGEKLGDDARLLTSARWAPAAPAAPATGSSGDGANALRGYFVIRAPDLARALEVARTCPHLKRGGRILVRPIVPV
jgi:hypothetical protein